MLVQFYIWKSFACVFKKNGINEIHNIKVAELIVLLITFKNHPSWYEFKVYILSYEEKSLRFHYLGTTFLCLYVYEFHFVHFRVPLRSF